MIEASALVEEMCEETRAGWSWMLPLSEDEAPAWLAFHGPQGTRDDPTVVSAGPPRLELWPKGGGPRPLVEIPVAANRDFHCDIERLRAGRLDHYNGGHLLLALLRALAERTRARPRIPVVRDALTHSGVPTLDAWASALTLADFQAALLRAHR